MRTRTGGILAEGEMVKSGTGGRRERKRARDAAWGGPHWAGLIPVWCKCLLGDVITRVVILQTEKVAGA